MAGEESLFAGSGDQHGLIWRTGDTVVRPVGRHSRAVHALLRHLEAEGFDGAPRLVSTTQSEEVLTFVGGEVPVPLEPPADGWIVVPDRQAASVGKLLARFHYAARSFPAPRGGVWQGGFTPGLNPSMVCHNDPVVGNVVFRDGVAVALIDFDYAGPNDPLRDLAIAAQHWVPLGDPDDVLTTDNWDPAARLAHLAEAYELDGPALPRVLDLIEDYLERGRQGVQARVRAGEARFVAYWDAGLGDRLLRAAAWLRNERRQLLLGAT